jgi:tetratricopeptide (TPR) repeat protein/TolB-like protein
MSATPSVPTRTTFSPDERVADRFRILRFVARGGMGEVYEAEDELLHTRVALKTLRAHVAEDDQLQGRFRREILFARRVTHPNVCRIFDVFQHMRVDGAREVPIPFLTMELLAGETLAERLRATGLMKPGAALPIVAQMVAALAAAHRAGVIHRDLKTGNVMLVPAQEEGGPDRAVITDFGLARARGGEPGEASSSGGEMVGTTTYMAPEQVVGGIITPAADLYALGVVMYEMVTGVTPFSGDTPMAIAVQRLEVPPPPPTRYVPDLDPLWEKAILRCLQRDAEHRFASAEGVLLALTDEAAPPIAVSLRAPAEAVVVKPRLPIARWAGVAALLVVVAAAVFVGSRSQVVPPEQAPGAAIKSRRSIAVLGFKNLSGRSEAAWLSTALSEMLATELAATGSLRTLPGENVARMKADLALPEATALGGETLERIRAHLDVDLVVLGSYLAVGHESGGRVRLDLRVQDTVGGASIASIAETGTEAEILDLVARSGASLREKLGVSTTHDVTLARGSLPGNLEAARLYSAGIEKLRLFDARAARDLLQQAVAADPDYALGRLALSEAWSALGHEDNARTEAQRAFESSRDLPRDERLRIEARYHETAREWKEALEIYQVLFGFFPDEVEYGLRLAQTQTAVGRGEEALATLQALRRLPAGAVQEARIDVAEASVAQVLSDFRRERTVAARAAERAEKAGARLIVAAARDLEGWALLRLGDHEQALGPYAEAQKAFTAAGHRAGAARVLGGMGAVMRSRGDLAAARARQQEALAIFREIGDRAGVAWSLTHLGSVAEVEGDAAAARQAYEESLAIQQEIGDKPGLTRSLLKLAELAAQEGDLATARTRYTEVLAAGRSSGTRILVARALFGLGETQALGGDIAAARASHEDALRLREATGERGSAAESRVALAALSLDEGRLTEAETLARAATEELSRLRMADPSAAARVVLANALLAQGRWSEAQGALRDATTQAGENLRPSTRVGFAIAGARVRAAGGGNAEARRDLEALLAGAARSRVPALLMQAQLALGELEMSSPEPSAGRERLKRLERDAASRGFLLVARKAAEARRSGGSVGGKVVPSPASPVDPRRSPARG